MAAKNQTLSINSLLIDTKNPRFEIVSNQREAIQTMIEDQKEKLSNLATDTVSEGLNPGDPIYVIKNEVSSRKYDVS